MGKMIYNGVDCGGSTSTANQVNFDDTNTQLGVHDMQSAIEVVSEKIVDSNSEIEAINEILGKRNLQTYTTLSQLNITTANTITELMAALPNNSFLQCNISNGSTVFNQSLPSEKAGVLTCKKGNNSTRGEIKFVVTQNSYEAVYEGTYYNSVVTWLDRTVTNSDLANYLGNQGSNITTYEDWATAPRGFYANSKTSNATYNILQYCMIYKPSPTSFNGAFLVKYQGTEHGIYHFNNETAKFEKLALKSDISMVGETINIPYVEIGINDNVQITASLCLKKLSATKCDLYISYHIVTNTETTTDLYILMSGEKIRTALGVSSLSTVSGAQSQVTLIPIYKDGNGDEVVYVGESTSSSMGHTGLSATLSANGIGIGRIYTTEGGHGSWAVTNKLFKSGTYGQINFYGANYTI